VPEYSDILLGFREGFHVPSFHACQFLAISTLCYFCSIGSTLTIACYADGSKTLAEVAKELVGELIFVKVIMWSLMFPEKNCFDFTAMMCSGVFSQIFWSILWRCHS
jgi:hypothetical protein